MLELENFIKKYFLSADVILESLITEADDLFITEFSELGILFDNIYIIKNSGKFKQGELKFNGFFKIGNSFIPFCYCSNFGKCDYLSFAFSIFPDHKNNWYSNLYYLDYSHIRPELIDEFIKQSLTAINKDAFKYYNEINAYLSFYPAFETLGNYNFEYSFLRNKCSGRIIHYNRDKQKSDRKSLKIMFEEDSYLIFDSISPKKKDSNRYNMPIKPSTIAPLLYYREPEFSPHFLESFYMQAGITNPYQYYEILEEPNIILDMYKI